MVFLGVVPDRVNRRMGNPIFRCRPMVFCTVLFLLGAGVPVAVEAYTPKSPEVRAMIDRGIKFLESEKANDDRLGAKALSAMALVKHGARRNHPRVQMAVEAVQKATQGSDPAKLSEDIYSTGLSIIFLVTLDPQKYGKEITFFLESLRSRQKDNGGWGYARFGTGDTSMTQYGVLSHWEAAQAGINISTETIEKVAIWLSKTQDPTGGFGYQGKVSRSADPVRQYEISLSMTAAGLGSTYICSDILGLLERRERRASGVPAALTKVEKDDPEAGSTQRKTTLSRQLFQTVQGRGMGWMKQNDKIEDGKYVYYSLYALERCMSFRELAEGIGDSKDGPKWYNDGVAFVKENQKEDGSWRSSGSGSTPATAFAILFLMRSTKKSIQKAKNLGGGMLVGARGLPKDTDQVELLGGKVVAKAKMGAADRLLKLINATEDVDYSQAADLLAELPPHEAEAATKKHTEAFRRLVADKSPEARIAAIRALATHRNLENVPTLIYALTDPDLVVLREARDALRRIGRKPKGFGLTEEPSQAERLVAIGKWKAWYLAVRPDAEFVD